MNSRNVKAASIAAAVILLALGAVAESNSEVYLYAGLALLGLPLAPAAAKGVGGALRGRGGGALALAVVSVLMVGCSPLRDVGPRKTLGGETEVRGLESSVRSDLEAYQASSNRLASSAVEMDADGVVKVATQAGDDRVSVFSLPMISPSGEAFLDENGKPIALRIFMTDPSDTTIELLDVSVNREGEMSLRLEGFGASKSTVIAAHNTQVIASLEAAQAITAEQAETARRMIEARASVVEALIEAGVEIGSPVPLR